jgi:hypothetical protein
MLFHLLAPYAPDFIFFNLFRYITFRTGGAMATALIICFMFGPIKKILHRIIQDCSWDLLYRRWSMENQ